MTKWREEWGMPTVSEESQLHLVADTENPNTWELRPGMQFWSEPTQQNNAKKKVSIVKDSICGSKFSIKVAYLKLYLK